MGGVIPAHSHIKGLNMSNHIPKHLKLVQAGYEGYTGPIGPYDFVDGLSVDKIPLNDRDRLSAAFQLVEIDDNGDEHPAGAAHRLVADRANIVAAEEAAKNELVRMTDAEKAAEDIMAVLGGVKVRHMHSEKALEQIAEEGGISRLRLVANEWHCRSKSIPDLIQRVLGAQNAYIKRAIDALVEKGADQEAVAAMFALRDDILIPEAKVDDAPEPDGNIDMSDPEPERVRVVTTSVEEEPHAAAATGDLTEAIAVEE